MIEKQSPIFGPFKIVRYIGKPKSNDILWVVDGHTIITGSSVLKDSESLRIKSGENKWSCSDYEMDKKKKSISRMKIHEVYKKWEVEPHVPMLIKCQKCRDKLMNVVSFEVAEVSF